MQDVFANRLGSYRTVKLTLNQPQNLAVWQGQPPLAFGNKVTAFNSELTNLESFIASHGQTITGAAVDKGREEEELETAAHELGSALTSWYRGKNDETNAALVARSISGWRAMRDAELLAQSQIVIDAAQAVVASPDAVAAADYGINAAAITALTGERNDYAAAVASPQQKIANRKALSAQYRPRFNAVDALLDDMDGLILQYRKTEAGRTFVAAYEASRVIRDLGHGPGTGGGGDGGGGSGAVPAAPAAPTLAVVGVGQVQASWLAVSGAQFIKVYKQVLETDPDYVYVGNVSGSPTTLTNLPPGEIIRVRLIAANTAGESEPGPFGEITMPAAP